MPKSSNPVPDATSINVQPVPRKKWRRRLVFWVLFLVLLAVTLGIGFLASGQHRPQGTGPAGPLVPREPFETTVWSNRKVLLLGIGDSVTAGFGVDAPHNYVSMLAENPPDELNDMQGKSLRTVLPNIELKNISVSGSTSLHHETHVDDDERFPMQPEDVFGMVVITTGGNDIIHNYGQSPPKEGAMYGASIEQATPWVDNFRERLDRLIDKINRKFPGGCQIYLADIYDPSDGIGDAPSVFLPAWPDCMKVLDAYNQVLHECAAKYENVFAVPMHDAFLGHGIHCAQFWRKFYRSDDPTYWFHDNLEDPNRRGYDAIRRVFLNEIINNFPKK